MFSSLSALLMVGSGLFLTVAPIISVVLALVAVVQLFRGRRAKALFLWAAGVTLVPLTVMLLTFLIRNSDQLPALKSAVLDGQENPQTRDPKRLTLDDVNALLDRKRK